MCSKIGYMRKFKCIICNGNLKFIISNHVRDSKNHKVIRCSKCKHVQLNPVPSMEEDKIFYDNNLQEKNIHYNGSIKENRKKGLSDLSRRVEFVSKITPKNGKILEIGSGYGFCLEQMIKKNYDIVGIEVSKERRVISKKVTKAKVLDVNIMSDEINLGKFHSIVLFHVLEHISNLEQFLQNMRQMLYQNGNVVIEVPNFDDYQIPINYEYKEWNLQRAHIHYFNPKTIKFILQKNGFKKINIFGVQRYGMGNMFNWKINQKPQLENPLFAFKEGYTEIEKNYKNFLEKNLISDTIIIVGK